MQLRMMFVIEYDVYVSERATFPCVCMRDYMKLSTVGFYQ